MSNLFRSMAWSGKIGNACEIKLRAWRKSRLWNCSSIALNHWCKFHFWDTSLEFCTFGIDMIELNLCVVYGTQGYRRKINERWISSNWSLGQKKFFSECALSAGYLPPDINRKRHQVYRTWRTCGGIPRVFWTIVRYRCASCTWHGCVSKTTNDSPWAEQAGWNYGQGRWKQKLPALLSIDIHKPSFRSTRSRIIMQ